MIDEYVIKLKFLINLNYTFKYILRLNQRRFGLSRISYLCNLGIDLLC